MVYFLSTWALGVNPFPYELSTASTYQICKLKYAKRQLGNAFISWWAPVCPGILLYNFIEVLMNLKFLRSPLRKLYT